MSLQMFDLSGKTAIVTGANTGLGQAVAEALAGAGANIVAVGRTAPTDTQAAVEALGRGFLPIAADLSSLEPVERIVAATVEWFGGGDILVNNAGVIRRHDALEFTEDDWDAVMDVNLKTTFFLTQAVGRRMVE